MAQFQSKIKWGWQIPQEVKYPVILLNLLFLVSALLSIVVYFGMQPVIPLFYTLTQPEQQLVAKEWIIIYPSGLALVSIIHSFILYRLQSGQLLLLQLFSWTSVLISLLYFISQIRLVMLVT
jgi:hypothetical protein